MELKTMYFPHKHSFPFLPAIISFCVCCFSTGRKVYYSGGWGMWHRKQMKNMDCGQM